jgi:hypothetical protein
MMKKVTNRWLRTGAFFSVVGSLLYACSGDSSAVPQSQGSLEKLEVPDLSNAQLETLRGEQAAVRVLMTDAPIDAEHVYVTICKVEVHAAGAVPPADAGPSEAEPSDAGSADRDEASAEGRWLSLSDTCHQYDLLALRNGLTTELGLQTLPPGRYGQIRLGLTEATIVVSGEEHSLTIPSGAESGLKIIHGFELAAGELTTLALDFDAARSIHGTRGAGYMMRPVIELVAERRERFGDVMADGSAASDSAAERSDDQPPLERAQTPVDQRQQDAGPRSGSRGQPNPPNDHPEPGAPE